MSAPMKFDKDDAVKWAKNTLIFSVPLLIIIASAVQGTTSWESAQGAMLLYLINSLVDLGKKFAQETK